MTTPDELKDWLAAYGRAWETKDPEAAVALFTEDAAYQESPFDEPMVGHDAIRSYWSEVEPNQDDISFEAKILSVGGERAFVHWKASYTNLKTGVPTRLDGMFLLFFDGEGLCRSLQEWWHADPSPSF
ncbi:MAG: nuclear transport factor 2 family protein [Actinomycetota bacterium]